ncbi:MAG: GNAT family N-acetyltransferase [Planctomycetes bacterium]|nr:GNAT family N-acetyltransferase [Planctomycetota bacterium]
MLTPTPVSLEGAFVRLEPLSAEHVPALMEVGGDPSIWTWMTRCPANSVEDMRQWLRDALDGQAAGTQLPFAIFERTSGRVAGSTRFLNISVRDGGLEIGWTWLGVAWQRTAVNTECKLLLLRHAFETLGCVRVQFKTDALNARSRSAIERIGGRFEGILRKYQATQGGRIRDTAMYSIIDQEWPEVRDRLVGLAESRG